MTNTLETWWWKINNEKEEWSICEYDRIVALLKLDSCNGEERVMFEEALKVLLKRIPLAIDGVPSHLNRGNSQTQVYWEVLEQTMSANLAHACARDAREKEVENEKLTPAQLHLLSPLAGLGAEAEGMIKTIIAKKEEASLEATLDADPKAKEVYLTMTEAFEQNAKGMGYVVQIQRLSQVLEYFQEYMASVSDDGNDEVIIEQGTTSDHHFYRVEAHGPDILNMLENMLSKARLKDMITFTVEVYHDCPGCCTAESSKKVVFMAGHPEEII